VETVGSSSGESDESDDDSSYDVSYEEQEPETLFSSHSSTSEEGSLLKSNNQIPADNSADAQSFVSDLICMNCKRQQVETSDQSISCHSPIVADRNIISCRTHTKRMWWLAGSIPRGTTHVPLCEQCYSYVADPVARRDRFDLTWPSFVWSVLRNPKTIDLVWCLIPDQWRPMWIVAFTELHGLDPCIVCDVPTFFKDVTVDLNLDIAALKSLRWKDLVARESSLVIPCVKCPAGCSEYKHKTNSLPLDIVWEECLQVELDLLYSPVAYRNCTRFFRSDYLMQDKLMYNWDVSASVAFHNRMPVVLCCREHDRTSKKHMIHPPRNPTGVISAPGAGGLSPVTVVPRTISTAQRSKYSASFHMASMEGSFYGLDTMYLSNSRGLQTNTFGLGWKQDVLSYAGREDIRAHADSTQASNGCLNELLRDADVFFPAMHEVKDAFASGSNFVSMSDSVNLQTDLNFGGPETAVVHNAITGDYIVQYNPIWPRRLVWPHPFSGSFGYRPPMIEHFKRAKMKEKSRFAWLLLSSILYVPSLWTSLTAIQRRHHTDWEGWVLSFLTRKCLAHVTVPRSRDNPFKTTTADNLIKNYFLGADPGNDFPVELFPELFSGEDGRHESVLVSHCKFPDVLSDTINVIIIYRNYMSLDTTSEDISWIPPLQKGKHKLIFIVSWCAISFIVSCGAIYYLLRPRDAAMIFLLCPGLQRIICCVLGCNLLFLVSWAAIYYFLRPGLHFIIYCVLCRKLLYFASWAAIYYLLCPGSQFINCCVPRCFLLIVVPWCIDCCVEILF
jgi:hypothetical protein